MKNTRMLDVVMSLIVTITLGLTTWALSRIVEHEKIIAQLTVRVAASEAAIAKMPSQFPPTEYRDKIEDRFRELERRLNDNKEILLKIDADITALRK